MIELPCGCVEYGHGAGWMRRCDRHRNQEVPMLAERLPLTTRFDDFRRANPHVYVELVMLARRAKRRGAQKLGIGQLFEVLRWRHMMATSDPHSDFKLNNDYRAPYARLIMDTEPDLRGIFDVRTSIVDRAS